MSSGLRPVVTSPALVLLLLLAAGAVSPSSAEVGGCEYLSIDPLTIDEGGRPLQRDVQAALNGTATEMVVGALGIKGSQSLFTQWNSSFATYLTETAGKQLNKTFRMVYLDWDTAYRATQDNCVDFVFSNPSLHLCLELQYQVTPLATLLNYRNGFKLDKFYGTIFTRADRDDITSIDDLKGKIVEAVSVTGLGAAQLQWHELLQNGINFMNDPKQVRFSYNQKKIVKDVISGAADVGMVRTDMAEGMHANGEIDIADIKVIHVKDDPDFPFPYSSSIAAPEWPLAHLPHVPTSTVQLVSDSLTDMTTDSRAAQEGLYAGWVPPVTYMSLFTMMGDLGFLTNNRCSGNSDTYGVITCPADTEKVSEEQIQLNCQALADENPIYTCPEDYICVCQPCAAVTFAEPVEPPAEGNGIGMAVIAGVVVAVLAALAAVALGVWYFRRAKGRDEEDAESCDRTFDSVSGSWNEVTDMVSNLAMKTAKPKAQEGEVTVQELLASGGNARVYRALWRGATVAQKRIQLPSSLSALAKKKTSLAMEAAISTSMSHPNVVHTYHWEMVPIRKSMVSETGARRVGRSVTAPNLSEKAENGHGDAESNTDEIIMWEMRIIQEYCELGSVTHCLSKGLLEGQDGSRSPPSLKAALFLAKDVACGMLHIHSMQIVHGDLKSGNVLLVESRRGEVNIVAKVADFGLSVKMDEDQTHVSGVQAGTLSHMSPELLLQGHAGKSVDVYAFGIFMYELFTGKKPWDGKNPAEIIHAVTAAQKRPVFPLHVPVSVVQLASDCWHQDPEKRPKFDEVSDRLTDILTELTCDTSEQAVADHVQEEDTNPADSIKNLQKSKTTSEAVITRQERPSRRKLHSTSESNTLDVGDDLDDSDDDDDDEEADPTVLFGQGTWGAQ